VAQVASLVRDQHLSVVWRPFSAKVGENAKINDGIEEVGGNGNEDIPGNEQAGAPQEAREDSAIQRAAMFEQTWQSNIPSEKVVLQTRPQAPPISVA